ncbi:MAG: alpha/beta fold hydrolase [Candidatus Limnocylindrales bacterium]
MPRPQALTHGTVRDTKPRLSADGRTVAFIRSDPLDDEAPAGMAILDLRGSGAVRRLRRGGHGTVGDLAWSPDGRRLAFTAEVDPPRFLVGPVPPVGRTGSRGARANTPSARARRITRSDWRWDGEGHRDRWSHLFVLDRVGGRPRQITSGDWGVEHIAWHPDGRSIAFTADRGPEPDLHPRPTIWAVDVDDDAEPREILAPAGWATNPAWSPDGRWIAAIGLLGARPLDDLSPGLIIGPADGSVPPWALAPELDRPIGNWVDSDLNGWMVSGRHGPCWVDERTIVATVSDRGRSHPYRFTIDPATAQPIDHARLVDGEITTHTLAVAPGGGADGAPRIAFLGTDGPRAMELATLDGRAALAPSAWRTTFGSRWQDRFEAPEIRRIEVPSPAGPIETLVVSPPGAGDARLPTIVDVHGGPLGAWAPAPHLEVFLLAARGYRVVLPNVRGSATYGRDWIRPQLGDWGGVDAADVHQALDHVIALGLADPDRLGVLGLSYGGFMVNWLVGTTDRFKAAVSENGVTNQVSDWANSDSGPEYDRASLLGDPFLGGGDRQALAPIAAAQRDIDPHPVAHAPGGERPALPAPGQRATLHRPASPSGGRWSTSSIPTSRTRMRPAVDRTGGSTG